MTTYAKAWLVNGVWVAFFLLILSTFVVEALDLAGANNGIAAVIGFSGYFLMIFVTQHFPKCPNCKEPVNMPHENHGWIGLSYGAMVRPDRPSRECGYCGSDLTGKSDPE